MTCVRPPSTTRCSGETVDAEPDTAGVAAALSSATGVLRTMVGAGTGIRHTPSLAFVADVVPDEARRMEELLARTREKERKMVDQARARRLAKRISQIVAERSSTRSRTRGWRW